VRHLQKSIINPCNKEPSRADILKISRVTLVDSLRIFQLYFKVGALSTRTTRNNNNHNHNHNRIHNNDNNNTNNSNNNNKNNSNNNFFISVSNVFSTIKCANFE